MRKDDGRKEVPRGRVAPDAIAGAARNSRPEDVLRPDARKGHIAGGHYRLIRLVRRRRSEIVYGRGPSSALARLGEIKSVSGKLGGLISFVMCGV